MNSKYNFVPILWIIAAVSFLSQSITNWETGHTALSIFSAIGVVIALLNAYQSWKKAQGKKKN